jgi:hypothetical protein
MTSGVVLYEKFRLVFCRGNVEMFIVKKYFSRTNTLCYILLSEATSSASLRHGPF